MSNTMTFHGRLVADARQGNAGGTPVCNFKVASDVGFGDKKHTNWIECALWGKRAEGGVVPYLVKGAAVYISGELTIKDPRENNGKHYNDISVRVNDLDLIGGKMQAEDAADRRAERERDAGDVRAEQQLDDDLGDLPF